MYFYLFWGGVLAFTDLSSGFVHLVVEYMDGGSLQDIVDMGGCADEDVLADLSCQVYNNEDDDNVLNHGEYITDILCICICLTVSAYVNVGLLL